ncbi:hypothetical protein ACFWMG_43775, partial [Streptomyces sp. NPDC127074]|uniref:hypothetical protein n=1 Tax=Streptomyces sp. NPDC127074 TaxID=3347130 RepID=UPI00364F5749
MTVISAVPTLPVGALFSQTRREFASWYSRLWGPLGGRGPRGPGPRCGCWPRCPVICRRPAA